MGCIGRRLPAKCRRRRPRTPQRLRPKRSLAYARGDCGTSVSRSGDPAATCQLDSGDPPATRSSRSSTSLVRRVVASILPSGRLSPWPAPLSTADGYCLRYRSSRATDSPARRPRRALHHYTDWGLCAIPFDTGVVYLCF